MPTDDTPTHALRVHADTLEYTREGLRPPDTFALRVGVHNRIVIDRPTPVTSVAASHGGFAKNSSLPNPAVLSLLLFDHRGGPRPGEPSASGVFQVYAHADPSGGPDLNKTLTDRRAAVFAGLLRGEVEALRTAAADEDWGTQQFQVIARMLECDPGPIDGQEGTLTGRAVEEFRRRYLEGEFHTKTGRSPQTTSFAESTKLDAATRDALIEALVEHHTPALDEGQLHSTHAALGCAAFNLSTTDLDSTHRRISLVHHDESPPHSELAPCTRGDANACPALNDGDGPCLWYREHVRDAAFADVEHHHFRLAWLKLDSGDFLLSALTTVPDEEPLQFQVFAASEPTDGESAPPEGRLVRPLGDSMSSNPEAGVATVRWRPPADFAPTARGTIGDADEVPVFRVHHERSGAIAFDSFEGHDLALVIDRHDTDGLYTPRATTRVELRDTNGDTTVARPLREAVELDSHHFVMKFVGVDPRARYSLRVLYEDGPGVTLLDDASYADLPDLEALTPPPATTTPSLDAGVVDIGPPEPVLHPDDHAELLEYV